MPIQKLTDFWLKGEAMLRWLLWAARPELMPCSAEVGAGRYQVARRSDEERPWMSIDWYVFKEMRSNSGPRDSMPRDFYSSNYSTNSYHSSGSYSRRRTKGELAGVLALYGALVFGVLGLLCWGVEWLLFMVFDWGGGLVIRGALGGAVTGALCGVAVGVRSPKSRFMVALVLSVIFCATLASFGALLGLIVGSIGGWYLWPVGGAIVGVLVGIGVGVWKGA